MCGVSELVPLHRVVRGGVRPVGHGATVGTPRRSGPSLASGVLRAVERHQDYVTELQATALDVLAAGDLVDAVRQGVRTIHYIAKHFGLDDARLPASMLTIAQAYLRSNHVKRGLRYLDAAVRFVDAHPAVLHTPEGADVAATVFNEFGSLYFRAGRYDEAERYYWCQTGVLKGANADLTEAFVRMGLVKQMRAQYPQAAEFFGRALGRYQHAYGPDDHRAMAMLLHLGNVHLLAGHPAKALRHYSDCLAVHCRNGDDVGMATACLSMSVTLRIMGHVDDAKTTATRALCLRHKRYGTQVCTCRCVCVCVCVCVYVCV